MKKIIILILLICFSAPHLHAAVPQHSVIKEKASEDYATAACAKFICGISNLGLGWTEVFWYPSVSQNKAKAVLISPFRVILRAIYGLCDLGITLVPDATIPKSIEPDCAIAIIDPDVPFEK